MRSGTWSIVAIAVLGLVLAVALGIFADTIARGTVALPSTNLERTDTPLAPAQAVTTQVAAPKRAPRGVTTTGTTTTRPTTTSTQAADDHGGSRSGSGSDDSGGGSGRSGSGKSGGRSHPEDD
jgi:uncharacterized membrane protein YgcG